MDGYFTKKEKVSAVDYVINEIKNSLIQGKLKPGDRLPKEEELANELGVSRGSIRSAMKVFSVCGVIDIRAGDGTYVRSQLSQDSLNPMLFSLLILQPDSRMLAEFRVKIEYDMIELILSSSEQSATALEALEQNLRELLELRSSNAHTEAFVENDLAFHRALSHHSGNVVFETIYNFILEYFIPSIRHSHQRQTAGEASETSHNMIYKAIKEADLELAQEAISSSIDYWQTSSTAE